MIKDTRSPKEAVYLIDELFLHEVNHPVPSGWDYDPRGAKFPRNVGWHRTFLLECDETIGEPVTMSRRFMPIREGVAGFESVFTLNSGDGFFLEFYDDEDNAVITIQQKDNAFYHNGIKVQDIAFGEYIPFALNLDMDKGLATMSFFGKVCESFAIKAPNLARFKAGYRDGNIGSAVLNTVRLYINYLVNDRNEMYCEGNLSSKWTVKATGNATVASKKYPESALYTYRLNAAKGENVTCIQNFISTEGKICFELKYLSKNTEDEGIKFALTKGGKDCVVLYDCGTKLQSSKGDILRSHNPNVWQTLRIEADTEEGRAFVKLNGKKCGFIDFEGETDCFNGISISYTPKNGGEMQITDVFVFVLLPEPEDYPKPPVLPERKPDYVTGMNICSLWRNGEHVGWDAISAFHENITYMGFYDEGIPEVADWEIKWMTEHGLDCEFYCWYARCANSPNLKTLLSAAIHDGHFNAKYGDYMKLALIWEAAASAHPTSVEQVEKYFIPYFEDYFFTDPRYLEIDGVAIMSLYSTERLAKDLGSFEAVKQVVELLRKSAKKCGFKDLAIITCGEPSEQRKESGLDAVYAYGWGHNGYDPDYQKGRMQSQLDTKLLHVVPTVSVGYNDVAWRKDRYPMISCDDMGKVIKWFTDDLLPSYKDLDEEWKKKLMMFSTWNEYGEGTYICPANLNGFGYLNEMRKAVTVDGNSYESDKPTEAIKDRLGYLYPKGRMLLSAVQKVPKDIPEITISEIRFDSPECVDMFETEGMDLRFENGKLCGNCTQNDPKMAMKVDFDSEKVDAVALKFVSAAGTQEFNRENPAVSPVEVFFTTDKNEDYLQARALVSAALSESKELIMLTKTNPLWADKITHIRIDPTISIGTFELESIRFLTYDKGKVRYETYINGTKYNSHYRTKEEDGELYVLFEPLRLFNELARVYYEWDNDEGVLMTESSGITAYWKVGSDTVIANGKEIKLKKPVEMYDGLPYLDLKAFCELTGNTFTVNGNRVDITKKN